MVYAALRREVRNLEVENMERKLTIDRATGRAVTETGLELGRVVRIGQRSFSWEGEGEEVFRTRIITDSLNAMTWELAGVYGCAVVLSPAEPSVSGGYL